MELKQNQALEQACHHILWIWFQYGTGSSGSIEQKNIILPHQNMSAGESAAEFLESIGYVTDKGWHCEPTDSGYDLMGREY